jgi:hypothetical protein
MGRKYSDREYAMAESNIKTSIIGGIAETAPLSGLAYNEHSKPTIDAMVDAIYRHLSLEPKLWSLIAIAEKGGVPKEASDGE